jgi:hypothetical protein
MKKWSLVSAAVVMCWLCGQQPAIADTVVTIGDPAIFAAGTTVGAGAFDAKIASEPVGSQPFPFNGFMGNNTGVNMNFSASWTFTYPTDGGFTGATLTIGILDSPWEGKVGNTTPQNTAQVKSFMLDSTIDLTSILNTEINTVGTGLNTYEIDQITIPDADLSALASGTATFSLTLQGPGNEVALQGTPKVKVNLPSPSLAAGLGFSTLHLTPEPATWLLLLTGILGFGIARTLLKQP